MGRFSYPHRPKYLVLLTPFDIFHPTHPHKVQTIQLLCEEGQKNGQIRRTLSPFLILMRLPWGL